MKRTAFRMMIAAAAAMAAVATASAQGMKAEIPFPFQAAGARMQPGTYWVAIDHGSSPKIRMSNVDTRKGFMAVTRVNSWPSGHSESNPVLTFTCSGANCALSSVRDDSSTVYDVGMGKNGPGTRIAAVALKTDRAE